jgi:hypothetical protein
MWLTLNLDAQNKFRVSSTVGWSRKGTLTASTEFKEAFSLFDKGALSSSSSLSIAIARPL